MRTRSAAHKASAVDRGEKDVATAHTHNPLRRAPSKLSQPTDATSDQLNLQGKCSILCATKHANTKWYYLFCPIKASSKSTQGGGNSFKNLFESGQIENVATPQKHTRF